MISVGLLRLPPQQRPKAGKKITLLPYRLNVENGVLNSATISDGKSCGYWIICTGYWTRSLGKIKILFRHMQDLEHLGY